MTRGRSQTRILWFLAALFLFGASAHAAPGNATITYRRVFKGSSPEFIEIKVSDQGQCTYDIRQLSDDADPEAIEVGPDVRKRIFETAAAINNFNLKGTLDIQKKIANLGQKTLRYENGAEVHETSFNYTLNSSANDLMQIFEGLARQQEDLDELTRSSKFDRLGVNDALLQFESDLDHRILPEPERLLPILDQIAADSHFLEIARQRARALAERIRNSQGH